MLLIGTAARLVGVTTETLRNWERSARVPIGQVKRDYRNRRVYSGKQVELLQKHRDALR